ncbi:MAG: hypothetical protein BRC36_16635 [Cyanobacteria bacterium QH_2_48_84]|nr:MAG: hypothetical protein BRC36_16635 [Cyanobacteria bacterium QH_2_48_84]
MTYDSESNIPKERSLMEVSDHTKQIVEENMPAASEKVKQETKELIEATSRKAQSEAQKASELTQDTYLQAVRTVREEVESTNMFDPERIEYSFKLMQMDAERNWEALTKDVQEFGDRLNEAATAAWEILTAPREDDSRS